MDLAFVFEYLDEAEISNERLSSKSKISGDSFFDDDNK